MGVIERNLVLGSECNSELTKALALLLVLASIVFAVENWVWL